MKVLPINVCTNGKYVCTNGGISSKYETLYLICEEGYLNVEESNLRLVKIVTRQLFGKEHKHIEPFKEPNKNSVGWMAGGNIAYSCDSRFNSNYPLQIHDKQETYEQNEMLTR